MNRTFEQFRTRMAEINRAITPADAAVRARAYIASSVADLLPLIRVPTLVLHPRDYMMIPAEESMSVAAKIPGARYAYIGGEMLPGDAETGIAAIEAFLAELDGNRRRAIAAGTQGLSRLSAREIEVLRRIARGLSNQQIADEMVISVRTVERHINHIYAKLGVHNRAQATAYALSRSPIAP
jgi:DNA-binding CsgD family transcriptional regulator